MAVNRPMPQLVSPPSRRRMCQVYRRIGRDRAMPEASHVMSRPRPPCLIESGFGVREPNPLEDSYCVRWVRLPHTSSSPSPMLALSRRSVQIVKSDPLSTLRSMYSPMKTKSLSDDVSLMRLFGFQPSPGGFLE